MVGFLSWNKNVRELSSLTATTNIFLLVLIPKKNYKKIVKKLYFVRKHIWKNVVYIVTFL